MKEGWKYKKLGELTIIKTGKLDANAACENGKYPFFTCARDALKINSYSFDCECILIAGNGDLNVKYYKGKFDAYQRTYVIKLKEGLQGTSIIYIYWFMQLYLERLREKRIGAIVKYIKLGDLAGIDVPAPPLSEQQSIVDYLDSAFAKIDALKANVEKALNEAKALFQASLKEMLEPKEGWEYKKLGECFISINNGASIKQIKGAKGIPITRIETLSNDKFNRDRMGYADILDISPYTSYILNDGDILMSHINSMKYLGRAVQYLKKEDETIIHGMNLLRLVPTKDVLSSFLVYQFYTAFFRNQIVSISHQSVNQASFNTTNLKNLVIKVAPLSQQQRIVATLDSLKSKVDRLQENFNKISQECDAMKQAILKQVFE